MNGYYNPWYGDYPAKTRKLRITCEVRKGNYGWDYVVVLTNPPAGFEPKGIATVGSNFITVEGAEGYARRQAQALLDQAITHRDGPRTFVIEEAA